MVLTQDTHTLAPSPALSNIRMPTFVIKIATDGVREQEQCRAR